MRVESQVHSLIPEWNTDGAKLFLALSTEGQSYREKKRERLKYMSERLKYEWEEGEREKRERERERILQFGSVTSLGDGKVNSNQIYSA